MTKSLKTTNMYQFQKLVAELKKMPQAARIVPASQQNRQEYEDGWEEIKEQLNFLGPPTRTTAEWKKVWADFKTRVKRKMMEIERDLRRTDDDGPTLKVSLTPLEQDVELLIGQLESAQKPTIPMGTRKRRSEQSKIFAASYALHFGDPLQSSAVTDEDEVAVASFGENSNDASSNASASRPKRSKPDDDDEYLVLLRRQNSLLEENTRALGRIAEAIERLF